MNILAFLLIVEIFDANTFEGLGLPFVVYSHGQLLGVLIFSNGSYKLFTKKFLGNCGCPPVLILTISDND
jgi:hypothetical protein